MNRILIRNGILVTLENPNRILVDHAVLIEDGIITKVLPQMNEVNFPGHLIFGLSQAAVDTTIVGGKVLMRNKRFTFLDEEKISKCSQKLSASLWERF